MYVFVCIYLCIMYVCVNMYVCKYVCMCVYVSMYVCMCKCVCMYVCTYIHIGVRASLLV
jgi:hypothetical protein